MPQKNKGNKNKKKSTSVSSNSLVTKDDMQEYAKIEKMLGDRKVTLTLPDGRNILGIIPGRFRKRCWMKTGDTVLISFRDFQDDRCDIIHKYDSTEVPKLVKLNEIPISFITGETNDEEDDGLIFVEDHNDDLDFQNI